jgi:hypothetical protein
MTSLQNIVTKVGQIYIDGYTWAVQFGSGHSVVSRMYSHFQSGVNPAVNNNTAQWVHRPVICVDCIPIVLFLQKLTGCLISTLHRPVILCLNHTF